MFIIILLLFSNALTLRRGISKIYLGYGKNPKNAKNVCLIFFSYLNMKYSLKTIFIKVFSLLILGLSIRYCINTYFNMCEEYKNSVTIFCSFSFFSIFTIIWDYFSSLFELREIVPFSKLESLYRSFLRANCLNNSNWKSNILSMDNSESVWKKRRHEESDSDSEPVTKIRHVKEPDVNPESSSREIYSDRLQNKANLDQLYIDKYGEQNEKLESIRKLARKSDLKEHLSNDEKSSLDKVLSENIDNYDKNISTEANIDNEISLNNKEMDRLKKKVSRLKDRASTWEALNSLRNLQLGNEDSTENVSRTADFASSGNDDSENDSTRADLGSNGDEETKDVSSTNDD